MTTKAQLQEENAQLRAMLTALVQPEEKGWVKVTNLTHNHIVIPDPSNPDNVKAAGVLEPFQSVIVSEGLFDNSQQGYWNKDLIDKGLISVEPVETFEPHLADDSGRQAAFSSDVRLGHPNLENLASQILNYPGDTLPDRVRFSADGCTTPEMGNVIWALIMAAPKKEGAKHPDYRYLAETHRPFLQNVLKRERLWRNRPAIVGLLEQRIEQLSDAALLAAQDEAAQDEFERRNPRL